MVALGACRAEINYPTPGDDCTLLIDSDVASATDGLRTVGEVLSFVRDEWLALSVTWDDGSRSTVDVTITIGDETEALVKKAECDNSSVLVTGLDLEVRLDDSQAVVSGMGTLGFAVDRTGVSDQAWSPVEAEMLAGPFAELELETLTLQWYVSDNEPDKLILGDAGGEVFVCDESVHGDCLQPR